MVGAEWERGSGSMSMPLAGADTGADGRIVDAGLGAADYPFLNVLFHPDGFGRTREVADEIAMLVLDKMDEGPDSQGDGAPSRYFRNAGVAGANQPPSGSMTGRHGGRVVRNTRAR